MMNISSVSCTGQLDFLRPKFIPLHLARDNLNKKSVAYISIPIPILSSVEMKVVENHIARFPKISLQKCLKKKRRKREQLPVCLYFSDLVRHVLCITFGYFNTAILLQKKTSNGVGLQVITT